MSRISHFRRGVSTAYLLLGANTLYSLASVPLALSYLSTEGFGLWAIVMQLGGYLQLIELGMTSAFSRLIIDFRGKESEPGYGQLCSSAVAALLVQAALMVLAGIGVAFLMAPHLGIGPEMQSDFTWLMAVQSGVIGLVYTTRIFSVLLFANHRIAVNNLVQILCLLVSIVAMWVALHLGMGIYSLPASIVVGLVCSLPFSVIMTLRLKLMPASWYLPDLASLKSIFGFGRDIFLIHVGTMLISASQVIIVSNVLGIGAAAIWAVCIRPFNLLTRFCWRPIDLAYTFFSEMFVRGEHDRLRERYHSLLGITLLGVSIGGVGIAVCNGPFVELWTQGRISWDPLNDALLGLWMIGLTVARFGSYTIQATKEIAGLKYIYFIEGALFIGLGLLATRLGGIPAMLALSILLTAVFTGSYCSWRMCRLFGEPFGKTMRRWLLPSLIIVVLLGGVAWGTSIASGGLGAGARFVINGAVVFAGGLVLTRFVVDPELKAEILSRVPGRAATLLGRLWGRPAVV